MLTARVYSEVSDVDARLTPFGVTRSELLAVVRAVVAARADSVPDDPLSAAGQFAYIFGTRELRALFGTKGWTRHRHENIEATRHPDKPLRVIYQSVDVAGTAGHAPRAVSGKGSGANRVVDSSQGNLFSEEELASSDRRMVAEPVINSGAWFFCVSVNGEDVRAELSLPAAIADGNFKGFLERIFIVRPGEWASQTVDLTRPQAVQFEPAISRK